MNKTMQKTNKNEEMIKEELIEHMKRGKESAKMVRALLSQRPRLNLEKKDQDFYKLLEHHTKVALDAYDKSLSMLTAHDHIEGEFIRKRKINHIDRNSDGVDHCKSEECGVEKSAKKFQFTKDTRRSYKMSKTARSRVEEVTHLTDDGFVWRKYGQKDIINSSHPRHYYRCTHKYEQNCEATKQVQQISDKPPKYRIMYNGNHTCNNTLNSSQVVIDQFEENSSSILLSFGSKDTIPKYNLYQNSSLLFPKSASSSASQDCSSFKEDIPSTSDNSYELINHCSSSSNDFSSFEGQATTNEQSLTPLSQQASVDDISVAENCSLIESPNNYMEEDFVLSYILANFCEVLQDV